MRAIALIRKICIVAGNRLIGPFVPYYYRYRWAACSKLNTYSGLVGTARQIPIVVSLTSFPARIGIVHNTIQCLLMQSVKPDKLILWLAIEQFPEKEKELPSELIALRKYGLSIEWCHDIRSFKKLVPTLEQHSDAIVITADDDLYYRKSFVKRLYDSFLQYPEDIHCHRITKIFIDEEVYHAIPGGYDTYMQPSFLHKLTGCGGTCYPPHSLYNDVCKLELFMTLAPTNDDIWFWLMAVLNGRRIRVVKHNNPALQMVEGTQQGEELCKDNDNGPKLFWKQFYQILGYYPQIDTILSTEMELMLKK
ncbi:hypothetical protein SDC9_108499 [bioreactor metagenome]|uniref:Glycosyltransferase 2-like domain-containing protein n=1 Tax=bioreactor metagenome TaxID=1076179 RepID=A0A645B843_9ZZZZ|nr:hypothetical protein [Candidatus Metalachnospira sp.]